MAINDDGDDPKHTRNYATNPIVLRRSTRQQTEAMGPPPVRMKKYERKILNERRMEQVRKKQLEKLKTMTGEAKKKLEKKLEKKERKKIERRERKAAAVMKKEQRKKKGAGGVTSKVIKKKEQRKKKGPGGASSSYGPISMPKQSRKTMGSGASPSYYGPPRSSKPAATTKRTPWRRTSTSSSGSNHNNNRKRPRFQLKLPSNRDWPYNTVPWFPSLNPHITGTTGVSNHGGLPIPNDDDDRDESSTTSNMGSSSSPLGQFSSAALKELSSELQAFANYVSLTDMELDTRHSLIQLLTDVTGSCYPTVNHKDIQFQCFGSFATPSICCFGSDVDLALWGVVPSERKVAVDEEACTIAEWHQEQEENMQSSSKVQKWRDVLSHYEKEQEELLADMQMKQNNDEKDQQEEKRTSTGAIAIKEEDEDEKQPKKKKKKKKKEFQFEVADEKSAMELGAKNNDTPPLFVIDRVGDSNDDGHFTKAFDNTRGNSNSPVRKVSSEEEKDDDGDNEEGDNKEEEDVAATASVSSKSSSGDSADKLANFSPKAASSTISKNYQAQATAESSDEDSSSTAPTNYAPFVLDDSSDDEDNQLINQHQRKRRRLNNSDDGIQKDDFEVSFHSNQHEQAQQQPSSSSASLSPDSRQKVIRALGALYTKLRKQHSHMVSQMELRRRAKVPIVYLETKYGFEVDIAIGGHQGMDTSQLPESLVEKYQSFAPVVLFLKVLLTQQDLDKPFTGGLGSYRLYVMVAHHLERYLEMGGNDEPGEVLMSFLRRFGCVVSNRGYNSHHCTRMDMNKPISCQFPPKSKDEFYEADLQSCFLLDDMVQMFLTGWNRLSNQLLMRSTNDRENDERKSFLVELIRPNSLQQKRQYTYDSAINFKEQEKHEIKKQQHRELLLKARTEHFISRRQSKTSRKKLSNIAQQTENPTEQSGKKSDQILVDKLRDPDAGDLMKGYNVQGLDTNGNLIPASVPTFITAKKKKSKKSKGGKGKRRTSH